MKLTKHLHLGLIGLAVLGGFGLILNKVDANNPAFFFSSSSSCSFVSSNVELEEAQNQTVYLCVDGSNEGSGFLGAEVSVAYDTNLIEVNSVSCQNFDSCSNLSGPGTIRLIGASGALPDGNAVTGRERLASISLKAKAAGSASMSFTVARVIDERNTVSSRIGVGMQVNIAGAPEPVVEPPRVEEPVGEVVAEEPVAEEPIVEAPPVETPTTDDLFGLVITPLKKTGQPGDQIQIISKATYNGDRPDENATSCFPCPTAGNKEAEGMIQYQIVSGPASMYGSKLNISPNAQAGDKIYVKATFTDYVSGMTKTSLTHSITVVSPAEEEVVEEANEDLQNPQENVEAENQVENEILNENSEDPIENEIELNPAAEEINNEIPNNNELANENTLNLGNQNLICHVDEQNKGKYIGDLMFLGISEAKTHLENHPDDYQINELDENPNNDIESCLGVNELEILPLAEFKDVCCDSCEVKINPQPNNTYCALNFSNVSDRDEDGLSDRTECYLNTDHLNEDTDQDGCWDGDEINKFQTNPLQRSDCSLKQIAYEKIVISDPQVDWIVRYLDISGTTPEGTEKVDLTAYPAEHTLITNMIRSLETINGQLNRIISPADTKALEEQDLIILEAKNELEKNFETLEAFIDTYNTSDYRELERLSMMLKTFITQDKNTLMQDREMGQTLLNKLKENKQGAIYLGSVDEFKETGLGEETVAGFHLIPELDMNDGVYDLVAIASIEDRTLTSEPVRLQLDHNANVNNPMPQALDGITLNPEMVKNLEVDPEAVLHDVKVITKNGKPVVTGQSTYGAQIFATWESLSLASSIIVDSNEGNFEMQAPRYLERNEDHKITLYAVVEDDNGRVRSDSISVDFKVNGRNVWVWALGVLILAGIAGLVARRRMKKIDSLPPEHRAKENELYHAFGEKEHEPELPKDHNEKEAEVEEVFGEK